MVVPAQSGSATGGVRRLLRAEGLAVLLASVWAYHHTGAHWATFAVFLLAPDLAFFAYLAGPSVGAAAYDAVHSYVLPAALLCAGIAHPAALPYALIWLSHIGLDRSLGYGLKYRTGFNHTHLGLTGKTRG